MKIKTNRLLWTIVFGVSSVVAQEKTKLKLEDAIQQAWKNSNEVSLANTKVTTKKHELQTSKNSQYPDLKISGQYQRLTTATIKLKIESDNVGAIPNVDQFTFGQFSAVLPVFSGLKIRNSINLSDQLYQAEAANALQTQEEVAMKIINLYAGLYKAQKTVEILNENQKRAKQRVIDFTDLEKNGIISRNDLLKSQLQSSKIQLSIDEAINRVNTINFQLTTILKINPTTAIEIIESDFVAFKMDNIPQDVAPALKNRKDLEALQLQEKASQYNIKIAKGNYYPSVALLAGYIAMDLSNIVTVENATNVGIGVSYDLSSLYKNDAIVKTAQSKALEVQNSEALLIDYIKIEVQEALENYDLALKQDIVYGEAVDQASENYRIVKDKYDNGLSDTNDLLEADVDQLSAKINKALAKANIIQKYYNLLSVTGQLSKTFNLAKI